MLGRRLWLVRHGYRQDYVDPSWPHRHRFPGDTPLSQEGFQQASELVAAFSAPVSPIIYLSLPI